MQWIEITINTSSKDVDGLCDTLENLGVSGLVIEDEEQIRNFLENNKKYWDYVDEEFEESIRGKSRVKFYLEDSPDGREELARLKIMLPGHELTDVTVRDEDWENNWKAYYKPVKVGERLLVVPQWEEAPETEGRTVLRLDPGLIFGTGTHPTTQMCMRSLEKFSEKGKRVLDLGCGSGILAISAILLGCDCAVGCDIDEKAPDVAMENAALNGIYGDRMSVFAGDVLADRSFKAKIGDVKYDIVAANIVADVIIALSPAAAGFLKDDGVFICSGIINGRENEVEKALVDSGFKIMEHLTQDEWNCFVCRLN